MGKNIKSLLTENDIIDVVCKYLVSMNYDILHKSYTNQKGIDIEAKKECQFLYVEAKGETSSKPSTNRYGKPFSRTQIYSHISKAIYKSLQILSNNEEDKEIITAIAIPDTRNHNELIDKVLPALNMQNIVVIIVDHSLNVNVISKDKL